MNPAIFKAYDVRGIHPDELSNKTAFKVGAALARYLKPQTIAVGRDMRISSLELLEHLTRGINENGVDVVDLGLVSTDGL